MLRSFPSAVLFGAALFVSAPEVVTAQHSVGPRSFGGGAPVAGPGVRLGGSFGHYGGVRLGPLPFPNHSASQTWQLHPNLYPRINYPHAGSQFQHFSGMYPFSQSFYYPRGHYYPGSYFYSGYAPYYSYPYSPSYSYAPSNTYAIPPTGYPTYPPPVRDKDAITADMVAEIQVRVPAEAKVWFDGVESTLAGTQREFASTPIPPGLVTTYEVRARWTEDGREIEQTRRVAVRGGGNYVVDFTAPEEKALPKR